MMPLRDAAASVLDVIGTGGLAVVPLDVSYAFLAGSIEPLERIYRLKLRPASRPCPILATWGHFLDASSDGADEIQRVKRVVDGGLPIGVLTTPNWKSDVMRSVPRECLDLLVKEGKLAMFINMGGISDAVLTIADVRGLRLFGSSANISGRGNSFALSDVPESMLDDVDIICDAGTCLHANPERLASSIMDVETGDLTRRGILHEEIERLIIDSGDRADNDPLNSAYSR